MIYSNTFNMHLFMTSIQLPFDYILKFEIGNIMSSITRLIRSILTTQLTPCVCPGNSAICTAPDADGSCKNTF